MFAAFFSSVLGQMFQMLNVWVTVGLERGRCLLADQGRVRVDPGSEVGEKERRAGMGGRGKGCLEQGD